MSERNIVALPAPFADLGQWGPDWFHPTDKERHVQRVSSDLATVKRFYAAVLPRMDAIIAHLNAINTVDPAKLSETNRNLYFLALNCMEMSHPVDMKWKSTDIDDTFPWQRLEFLPIAHR